MKIRFTIRMLDSGKEIARLHGRTLPAEEFSTQDMTEILAIEKFLDKLTGYRLHIAHETVEEE